MKLIFLRRISVQVVIATGLLFTLTACGGGGGSSGSGGTTPSSVAIQKSSVLAVSSSGSSVSISSLKSSLAPSSSSSKSSASAPAAKSWGEVSYVDRVPDSYYGIKNPQLAAGPEGKLTLAWLENGIWVKQYSPATGWASTPTQLEGSNKIDSISSGPLVAADSLGNVFVAWTANVGMGKYNVSVARYAPATGWSPVVVFESNYTVYDFSLAVNKKGDAVIAWGDWGAGNRIVAARYTLKDGWSAQEQLGSPLINTSYVRVKVNEMGNILVGWHDSPSDFKYTLKIATYTAASGWSAEQQLDQDDFGGNGGQMWPELAVDSADNIWLFWRKQGDIWGSRYSAQSGLSALQHVVDGSYSNEILSVAAAAGSQGDIRLVWHQRFHANLEQVSTKRYLPESGWGSNKVLVATGINRAPKLTLGVSGDAQVIWEVQDGGVRQLDSVYFNASASQISAVQPVIYSNWGGLASLSTLVDSEGNRWAAGLADEGGETRTWINVYK